MLTFLKIDETGLYIKRLFNVGMLEGNLNIMNTPSQAYRFLMPI